MKEFEVGQKLKLRKDLVSGQKYNGVLYIDSMNIPKITFGSYYNGVIPGNVQFNINESEYLYSVDMIEDELEFETELDVCVSCGTKYASRITNSNGVCEVCEQRKIDTDYTDIELKPFEPQPEQLDFDEFKLEYTKGFICIPNLNGFDVYKYNGNIDRLKVAIAIVDTMNKFKL